jgi:hypothetical protein
MILIIKRSALLLIIKRRAVVTIPPSLNCHFLPLLNIMSRMPPIPR